jgi:uncharacterized membrane protein YbhN (UPF0104 family)/membrane-associated phospholipid phosphatase
MLPRGSSRSRGGQPVRHPGDLLRVLLGILTLVASGIAVRGAHPGRFEEKLFRSINDLPGMLAGPLGAIMQLGSIAAVPIVSGAALLFGRVRMAVDVAVSGSLAWALARLLKDLIERGRPGAFLHEVLTRGPAATGLGFPSGHVAVAAALATSAAPYLPRPARRAAWAAVGLVALARVYAGAHLPVDVVGGAALGWTVGAGLHLLFGAPGVRPSPAAVRRALAEGGIDAKVRVASVDGRGSTAFVAQPEVGLELFVKVVSREQRNADWLFKAWRFLAFRGNEDEAPFATPKHQVEHEAYLALLAERAGVRTPHIVASGVVEGDGAFLAERLIQGRTLDTVLQHEVQDDVLTRILRQVRLLHQARLAHRDLRSANVMIDDSGNAYLLDFGFAEAAATDRRLGQDVAEMVTSLALIVGPGRASRAANEELGSDRLARALPYLQPLALSATTRHELGARRGLLEELRDRIASVAGIEPSPIQPMTRVRVKTVLLLVAVAAAVHILLPQVGELRLTLRALSLARPGWLVAGLMASAFSYVMAAVALSGAAGRRLALRRTVAVEVASSFANRLVPGGFGGLGTSASYLERSGVPRPAALAAVGLNAAAGVMVHVVALLVSVALLGGSELPAVHLPSRWTVLIAVVAILTIAGVGWRSPNLRERVIGPGREALRALRTVARQPRRALLLFGGSMGVTGTYALALAASLQAFGAHSSFIEVIAVYLGGSAIGSVSPTPGGLGAVEAALVAGLTALGVAAGAAVAGVLAFRLLTFWLPILPGILVFRRLSRRGVI